MAYNGSQYGWNSDLSGYEQCNPCAPCTRPRPPPRCPRPCFAAESFASLSTDREVVAPVIADLSVCNCPVGHAKFLMNSCTDRINYCGLFLNLSSPVTLITINRAAVGVNGPVVKNLTAIEHAVPSMPYFGGCCKIFWSVCGVWSRCDTDGQALTGMLADYFVTGALYINVSTVDNPAGEIRGQIFQYSEVRKQFGEDCASCYTPAYQG